MAKIEVYTTKTCPYCVRAKNLLNQKDVDFSEIDVTGDDAGREALLKKSNGMRTVPQIFINDKHIGGYDNLAELEQKGELDALLAS
jgi:glutaredoxin 3